MIEKSGPQRLQYKYELNSINYWIFDATFKAHESSENLIKQAPSLVRVIAPVNQKKFFMKKLIALFALCISIIGCSSIPSIKQGQSLDEYLSSIPFSGSVLVARDRKILHAKGYGFANIDLKTPVTTETQFLIGSLGKQFTALAVMQLQEQGMLHLDDPISKYLEDFPNGSKITIRNLLMHSAGLPDYINDWSNIKYQELSPDQLIDLFKNKPLRFTPGSKVEYSSSGYVVAGKIIEKISGLTYSEYIEKHIFLPLGMRQSAYGLNKNYAFGYKDKRPQKIVNLSIPYAAGALSSSVSDLYLWDQSFYDLALLTPKSISSIFPSDRDALGWGFGMGKYKVVAGLGWVIYETTYGPEYSHQGKIDGYSSVIARFPNQRALIVILSNEDQYDVWTLKNQIAKVIFN